MPSSRAARGNGGLGFGAAARRFHFAAHRLAGVLRGVIDRHARDVAIRNKDHRAVEAGVVDRVRSRPPVDPDARARGVDLVIEAAAACTPARGGLGLGGGRGLLAAAAPAVG